MGMVACLKMSSGSHLSKRFGLSKGRISQLRRVYQDDWTRFTSDDA